jgi:hypothetical protein
MRRRSVLVGFVLLALLAASSPASAGGRGIDRLQRTADRFDGYEWDQVGEAPWAGRAGLEAAVLGRDFYILGGRTPNPWVPPPDGPIFGDSTLWGDVWKSSDRGASWDRILETDDSEHWPARAYHEVVTLGGYMYLLGGQNFTQIPNPACGFVPGPCSPITVPQSEFFNDVWRSRDGVNWTQMTEHAPWEGRAGLSAIVFRGEIYVMGGSYNDDASIVDGQPERVLLNDVWKSRNGRDWVEVTDGALWDPRAGADLLVKNGYLYLLGGEFGFLGFPPPYYNDVWRTRDGAEWELVTPSAGWSPRPGHTCDVLRNTIVCFGGFGTDPTNPFAPANPTDVWISTDGFDWRVLSSPPWNAAAPADVKYDYDTVVAPAGPNGRGLAIYTFGGDRETFDFFDPTQWLNVDNDVWRFALPKR